jgi:fibronectin-binding autotransporter adhesin
MNRLVGLVLVLLMSVPAAAETWNQATGSFFWGDTANWVEGTVPNAIGATSNFDNATGTRTVTLGGTGAACPDNNCNFTVGALNMINNSGVTTTIRNDSVNTNTGISLIFDAAGTGPASINITGTPTNQNLILATMVFQDTVSATVPAGGNAAAGALSLTGDITGPGGFIKDGPGTLTMAFISGSSGQVKSYSGATTVNAGRLRLSQGGAPNATSGVTVNSGAQILLITGATSPNSGIYTFGPSASTVLTLNGSGLVANPGAIRLETGNTPPTQITNLITLASSTAFNVNGASNQLKLNNIVGGTGSLIAGALGNAADTGTLYLNGVNTYSGGTTVNLGTLRVEGASATLGTGNVLVDGTTSGASGKLIISAGVNNGIADNKTLTLTGGGSAGSADVGYLDLGINETFGGLVLGGVTKAPGTYGSLASSATFKDDEYFAGTGVLTVTPAGVPGDYNNNGVVDAADYVIWRSGGPLQNEVSGVTTGTVTAEDYEAWRARFGNNSGSGSGSGGGAAVPEPATLGLAGIVISLLLLSGRQKHSTVRI